MSRNFYVFQDWVARTLAEEGFEYITRPDYKDNSRVVYVFKNSEELQVAFDKIIEREQ